MTPETPRQIAERAWHDIRVMGRETVGRIEEAITDALDAQQQHLVEAGKARDLDADIIRAQSARITRHRQELARLEAENQRLRDQLLQAALQLGKAATVVQGLMDEATVEIIKLQAEQAKR